MTLRRFDETYDGSPSDPANALLLNSLWHTVQLSSFDLTEDRSPLYDQAGSFVVWSWHLTKPYAPQTGLAVPKLDGPPMPSSVI